MKPIITKFNTSTGDTEIMIAVPYRDPWESHINQPMPAYEEKERYNIFCLIKENKELKKQLEVKEAQQKEFIELLENEIKERTIDIVNYYPSSRLIIEKIVEVEKMILEKYREIMGVDN